MMADALADQSAKIEQMQSIFCTNGVGYVSDEAFERSTLAEYKQPYGCLTTRRKHEGAKANPAGGELRLLPGLVRMLRQLSTGR